MYQLRKKKNVFIFSDNGETYTPNKEIIEDIKSGERVHVKQFVNKEFDTDEFKDVYKIEFDDLIDKEMKDKNEEK